MGTKPLRGILSRDFSKWSLLLWLALSTCATVPENAVMDSDVDVKEDLISIQFRLKSKGCEIVWEYTKSNAYVEHSSNQCPLSLQDQIPLMARVYRHMVSTLGKERPFTDFFIGRLMQNSPDLAQRLALAAKNYEHWDTRTGRPSRGNRNGTVVSILNRQGFKNEYREAFNQFGLTLEADFVQEVSVAPALKIPFFGWLKSQGVGEKDYLPYDSRVGFTVLRADEGGFTRVER